jgi:creatinine amidohydrolase
MSLVEYELMAPADVVEARRAIPLVFVPVSPIEWHGPHLPLGTDGLHAHHVAVRVARQVGGVVLPTLFFGTETVLQAEQLEPLGLPESTRAVGMDFPGFPVKSLYIEESAFGVAVRDLVRALAEDEYRVIVLVNGHGATNHMRVLERIAREESRPRERTVMSLMVWGPPEPPKEDPGHAAREETAIMLAIAEERVHLERLPAAGTPLPYAEYGIVEGPAFDGSPTDDFTVPPEADPRAATRAEGEQILEREASLAVERIKVELARW